MTQVTRAASRAARRNPGEILVLGLGNPLRGDEAIGVRALERMSRDYDFPSSVRLVDGGTRGLGLLAAVQSATRLLVLDAVLSGSPAGSLARLEGEEVAVVTGRRGGAHDTGLADVLAVARWSGEGSPEVVVLGLEPAAVDLGFGLTPDVEIALDKLVAAAVSQLRHWGVLCTRRR